jgi:tRNA threonylcarbamoyladenosine biosynthesis protein TsaE
MKKEVNEIISKSPQETQEIARRILSNFKKGGVIALHGELGSGKTTFAQGIARALGITQRVVSPTFLIRKEYSIPTKNNIRKLYHLDLYRLQSAKEVDAIGIREIMNEQDALVLIEWPEKIIESLPTSTIHIIFEYIDETTRKIIIRMKDGK